MQWNIFQISLQCLNRIDTSSPWPSTTTYKYPVLLLSLWTNLPSIFVIYLSLQNRLTYEFSKLRKLLSMEMAKVTFKFSTSCITKGRNNGRIWMLGAGNVLLNLFSFWNIHCLLILSNLGYTQRAGNFQLCLIIILVKKNSVQFCKESLLVFIIPLPSVAVIWKETKGCQSFSNQWSWNLPDSSNSLKEFKILKVKFQPVREENI